MDYPHGNVGHHHHHNRRDDDDENNSMYPPPPPFSSHSPYPPPPPHMMDPTYPAPPQPHQNYPPPPQPQPPSFGGAYNPPPPHMESHHYPPPPQQPSYPHHHTPSFVGSHSHGGGPTDHGPSARPHGGGPEIGLGHLANRPSHKIQCKAGGERFAVGIRDHKVVLTHPHHSDLTQHWYKDEKFSTKVKDKEGHPSFMLVNKGTGLAVKHSISCQPVQLAPYNPDVLDESVLWTESKDLGSGFRTIRTVNNIHLVMDAWNADKDHGGIHDGTLVALYETWKGDNQNQQWKFVLH